MSAYHLQKQAKRLICFTFCVETTIAALRNDEPIVQRNPYFTYVLYSRRQRKVFFFFFRLDWKA